MMNQNKKVPDNTPIDKIRIILNEDIDFYKNISTDARKKIFFERVVHFINTVRFTDVANAKHTLHDEVLIATSAMIPLYNFPSLEYKNITEILLYENNFDENFSVDKEHKIMGMVGNGGLNNTMALSLKALRDGFEKKDGSNTAIHEFVHLIDKADGSMDGVPEYIIPAHLVKAWLRIIKEIINKIEKNQSIINPYAATSEIEFFAVCSEYFFEKPQLLQREHPHLYAILHQIFGNES